MNETQKVLNGLLVEVFHHILSIEGANLRKRGVNLSMNEVHVLEAIVKEEEPTMSHIAGRLRVTVGTLTTAINRLVEKGYCERKREKEDKRKVIVSLTTKAYECLEIHDKFHEEMISAVIEDLDINDGDVLVKALQNISDYFKKKY